MQAGDTSDRAQAVGTTQNSASRLAACILGDCALDVWQKTPADRLTRALARAGVSETIDESALAGHDGPLLLLRGDCVLDAPLIDALISNSGIVLLSTGPKAGLPLAAHAPAGLAQQAAEVLKSGAPPPPGLRPATSESLGSSYWQALRKREVPYAISLTPETLKATEWRMFMGTYKGATDVVTKRLWPWPAYHVTKACARLGLTPNAVTSISLVLVIAAFYWFLVGDWLLGLIAAWGMTFLDTVDGKLARITLNSSKFGNVFDHSIDLIHPPFWYLAWGLGVQAGGNALSQPELIGALAVIFAGYLLQRAIEGLSMLIFKIEIHIWRPIDTWFREITARRNPNLVLLTLAALFGRPDIGLLAVAVWTALCLLLHGAQFLQATIAWRRGGRLVSWMTKPL